MNKYFKIFQFFALFVAYKLLAVSVVHAATSTIDVGYPAFVNSTSLGDFVSQLYTYALGISGTLAIIMIIYGGIKYLTSAGNESALGEAKDIITNSIWGILLLAGAYLVLNTINPQLVLLKNPGLTPLPATPPPSSTATTTNPPNYTQPPTSKEQLLADVANSLIKDSGVTFSTVADCMPASDPNSIIKIVANTGIPMVCSASCTKNSGCQHGGPSGNIDLSLNMLKTLDYLACGSYTMGLSLGFGQISCTPATSFKVTSLTGDKHSGSGGQISNHYLGKAADIVLNSSNPGDWNSFINSLKSDGASSAGCEVNGVYPVPCSTAFDKNGNRIAGAHIHANW